MGRRVGSGKRGQRRTCPVWLGVLASHLRAGVCAASSACTKVIRLMNKTPALLIYTAYECIWTETLLSRAYLPIYPRTQSCRGGGSEVGVCVRVPTSDVYVNPIPCFDKVWSDSWVKRVPPLHFHWAKFSSLCINGSSSAVQGRVTSGRHVRRK